MLCVRALLILGALTAETAGKLDVADLEGDALGVEGAEVGVREEADGEGLGRLLHGSHSGRLPAETLLVAGSELADHALEGSLAHQNLGGLLELADGAESDGAGVEAALLLAALGLLGRLLGGLVDGGGLGLGHVLLFCC